MAKKKADYVAQGYADAMAGKPRAAIAAATWQAGAYDSGYDDGVRNAQANLAYPPVKKPDESLVAEFRKAAMVGASRAQKDANRRMESTLKRLAHKRYLAQFRVRPAPKRFFHDPLAVSHNIKRGGAMRSA